MDNIISLKNNQTTDTFAFTNIKLYSYGDKLKIPYFASSYHSNKTLDDCFKKLESSSGPLFIENAEL